MYHLMGFRRNLRNVMALAHYRPPAGRSADLIAVAAAYRAYLRTIQPGFTVSTQPTTEIVVDSRMARRLLAFGYSKSEDQDVRRLRASLRRRAQEPARD